MLFGPIGVIFALGAVALELSKDSSNSKTDERATTNAYANAKLEAQRRQRVEAQEALRRKRLQDAANAEETRRRQRVQAQADAAEREALRRQRIQDAANAEETRRRQRVQAQADAAE